MFEVTTLLAFVLASIAVYLAPGADMAYIAANSLPHGFRIGAVAASGTILGVLLQAMAAASGATAVFLISPILFEAVRWAGVAYLCYLGWRLLRAGTAAAAGGRQGPRAFWPVLLKGLVINLLNPKIALFFLAFLPQFADPARGSLFLQLLALGLMFTAGAVVWCYGLAWAFSALGARLGRSPHWLLWQNRISGGAMLFFAGVLALTGSRR